jgi:hypothetical protein
MCLISRELWFIPRMTLRRWGRNDFEMQSNGMACDVDLLWEERDIEY